MLYIVLRSPLPPLIRGVAIAGGIFRGINVYQVRKSYANGDIAVCRSVKYRQEPACLDYTSELSLTQVNIAINLVGCAASLLLIAEFFR